MFTDTFKCVNTEAIGLYAIIFDGLYGSSTLSSLLSTLDVSAATTCTTVTDNSNAKEILEQITVLCGVVITLHLNYQAV